MKLQLNKIHIQFSRIVSSAAENAFFAVIILFLAASLVGFVMFYKYVILAQKTPLEKKESPLIIDGDQLKNILQIIDTRAEQFKEADSTNYQNPFSAKP